MDFLSDNDTLSTHSTMSATTTTGLNSVGSALRRCVSSRGKTSIFFLTVGSSIVPVTTGSRTVKMTKQRLRISFDEMMKLENFHLQNSFLVRSFSGLYKAKSRLSRTFSFSPISSKNRLKKMLTSNSSLLHLNEKDNHNFSTMKRLSVPSRQVKFPSDRFLIRICLFLCFRIRLPVNEIFHNRRRDSCIQFKNIRQILLIDFHQSCVDYRATILLIFILSYLISFFFPSSFFYVNLRGNFCSFKEQCIACIKDNKSIDSQTI